MFNTTISTLAKCSPGCDRVLPAGGSSTRGARERWRKEWVRGGARSRPASPARASPALSAALAHEVALTLLHALDLVVQVCIMSC